MAGSEAPTKTTLRANYTSSSTGKGFSHSIPPLSNPHSTEEKTAYLSSLRSAVTKLQEEVNAFLTQKMNEDKDAAAAPTGESDEKKQEENYGEEIVED